MSRNVMLGPSAGCAVLDDWHSCDDTVPGGTRMCLVEIDHGGYVFARQGFAGWQQVIQQPLPEDEVEFIRWRYVTEEDAQKLGGLEP